MNLRAPISLLGLVSALCASAPAAQRALPRGTPVDRSQRAGPRLDTLSVIGTSRMLNPATLIANLDAENQVAGRGWLEVDGVVFVETFVGFHWSPSLGATPFDISSAHYFNENIQTPRDISDSGAIVGVDWFTLTGVRLPFRWTQAGGFDFLANPGLPWIGGAEVVSDDGALVGGFLQEGPAGTPNAVRWVQGALEFLAPARAYSRVHAMSADGSVIVGASGVDEASARAARWLDGVATPLGAVPGETASKALACSRDGQRTLGVATTNGRAVLVTWDAAGTALAHVPPGSFDVHALNALTPDGSAVVGELSTGPPWALDWAPFVWRAGGGFQVLGELGRPADYDRTQAVGVSDDGTRVLGHLHSSVVSNGDPPQRAVLWQGAEVILLDDLIRAAGLPSRELFTSVALSGDGRRILASGRQGPALADSGSVLISLRGGLRLR